MRILLMALGALLLVAPSVLATQQHNEASFPMARGFDDRMTVVSGEVDLAAPSAEGSAAFFRVSGFEVRGLTKACWQPAADLPLECVDGVLKLVVGAGSSLGFSADDYAVSLKAGHALGTFVDLSRADGFEAGWGLGPSALLSLVDGQVKVSPGEAGPGSPNWFNSLEEGGSVQIVTVSGQVVHTLEADAAPVAIEGRPIFPSSFAAAVAVVPFGDDATASFRTAGDSEAGTGLSESQLRLLDEILGNVHLIGADAKRAPFAILAKADVVLSEVVNGAFVRTSLEEDPSGLGDVAFAKFDELTVTEGRADSLDFEGSYTLVVGDLGPSFDGSEVSEESQPLRWWVGLFLLLAILVVGIWLWRREGPAGKAEAGPQTWVARTATAIGCVVAFLVWDWQLNQVLGSSLLTTGGEGQAFGALVLVELASLALAGLLIGVPIYLAVRYGLALAKQSRFASLAPTAGVFCTIGFGILLLPALVSFILGLAT